MSTGCKDAAEAADFIDDDAEGQGATKKVVSLMLLEEQVLPLGKYAC